MKLRSKSITDKRGQAQGGTREQKVINQINKISKHKSHYRRYQYSDEFLPSEMILSWMYRTYGKEATDNTVNYQTYKCIFVS